MLQKCVISKNKRVKIDKDSVFCSLDGLSSSFVSILCYISWPKHRMCSKILLMVAMDLVIDIGNDRRPVGYVTTALNNFSLAGSRREQAMYIAR